MESNFEHRLTALLNEYSLENQSNTPDFILAAYVIQSVENFNAATKQREEWYGRTPKISDLPVDIPFPTVEQPPYYDLYTTGTPPEHLKNTPSTGNPVKPHPSTITTMSMEEILDMLKTSDPDLGNE